MTVEGAECGTLGNAPYKIAIALLSTAPIVGKEASNGEVRLRSIWSYILPQLVGQ
ncbi:MAG: hypothetical protein GPJ10_18845 [Microcystis aeruginosa L211-07]|nr:hypothetical protein [Microcystis aeruginosa L211-07]